MLLQPQQIRQLVPLLLYCRRHRRLQRGPADSPGCHRSLLLHLFIHRL
jgi:hypothetical protein